MSRFLKMIWLRIRMKYHTIMIDIHDFISRWDKNHYHNSKAWDHLHKFIDLFNKLREIRDSA